MRIEFILVILLTILTIVFWSGKGGWLMASYNTMSDEEKQKYNYKRLCKVMGCCTGIIDFIFIILCLTGEPITKHLINVLCIAILAVVIITVILANTICRKRD